MTGTACDTYEYDENQTSCLNNFDLFSLRLFEKIKSNDLSAEDSLVCESIFTGNESTRPEPVTEAD
jgi:hypothetical protein